MPLEVEVRDLVGSITAEVVAVGYRDLASGEELLIEPDVPFHAASVMKVCVMMELFRQADAGLVGLDERLRIYNRFTSIVDGGEFSLDPGEDSEATLYDRIGEEVTLLELLEPMITMSSNLATNLLVERLGAQSITAFMRELGAGGLVIRRVLEDGKAYRIGLNNEITVRGLVTILSKLALGEAVSPEASRSMVEIMLRQTHRDCIPAGLPPGVRVANKPGWNGGTAHDAAIVWRSDGSSYVLVVLTKGLGDDEEGKRMIRNVSGRVWSDGEPSIHHF